MCKGNCGKCKKAEFETADVQVESLGQRSGMIVDDGWISVEDQLPKIDDCIDVWVNHPDSEGRVCNCFHDAESKEYWYWNENFDLRLRFDEVLVTHWRLPPPPPVK